MTDEDPPSLKEIFVNNFTTYLTISRQLMIDNPDEQNEYKFLGCTIKRTNSENNIWDVLLEQDEKEKPVLIDSINPDRFETARSLSNELARIAGVDFEEDDPEIDPGPVESPGFR